MVFNEKAECMEKEEKKALQLKRLQKISEFERRAV